MGKSALPCGCDETYAVYFGEYIACINASKHSNPSDEFSKAIFKGKVQWRWVPAQWTLITHKKEKTKTASAGSIPGPNSTGPDYLNRENATANG